MNLIDAAALRRVQSLGFRVVGPSDPPDLAEAQRVLLASGFHVAGPDDPPDLARARGMLERAGLRVVPERRRRIPEVGSVWEPARGRRVGYMRKVFAADSETVVCRDDLDRSSVDIVLKLVSFWDWKLRTGARRVV